MSTPVETSIDVDVAVHTAYNQWTQFEEFPRFMEGVEEVRQVDDTRLHWRAEIMGVTREWDAVIVEQTPDVQVAWASTSGARITGAVSFQPIDVGRTRVHLALDFDPDGFTERAAEFLGLVERRAKRDMERFKDYVEYLGEETGAWRGEIHHSMETRGGDGGYPA